MLSYCQGSPNGLWVTTGKVCCTRPGRRLLPDLAGADQRVLLTDRLLDVAGGDAERGHAVRIHPDAHRLIGGAQDSGLPRARHAPAARRARRRWRSSRCSRRCSGCPCANTAISIMIEDDFFCTDTPSCCTAEGSVGRARFTRFCTCTCATSGSVFSVKNTVSDSCPVDELVDVM